MKRMVWLIIGSLTIVGPAHAAGLLDRLAYQSTDGGFWMQSSGNFELTGYQADEPPPALILDADGSFLQPRLGMMLDAGLGERLLAHVLVNVDRGLDPGYRKNGHIRVDEYFLQATVFDPIRGQLRVDKF